MLRKIGGFVIDAELLFSAIYSNFPPSELQSVECEVPETALGSESPLPVKAPLEPPVRKPDCTHVCIAPAEKSSARSYILIVRASYLLGLEHADRVQGGGAAVIDAQAQPAGHLGRGRGGAAHLLPVRAAELLLDPEDERPEVELGAYGRVVGHHVDRHVVGPLERGQPVQGRLGARARPLAARRGGGRRWGRRCFDLRSHTGTQLL